MKKLKLMLLAIPFILSGCNAKQGVDNVPVFEKRLNVGQTLHIQKLYEGTSTKEFYHSSYYESGTDTGYKNISISVYKYYFIVNYTYVTSDSESFYEGTFSSNCMWYII